MTDVDMLRLEAPTPRLQIENGETTVSPTLEINRPASWVLALVHQHEQAQVDIQLLYDLCGGHIDHTDRRIRRIEQAYDTLYRGTLYVYQQTERQQNASNEWIQSELMRAANAYQTFSREVWQAIMERTTETDMRSNHQATQIVRLNDAMAFLTEANAARNHQLSEFTAQVSDWATRQNAATLRLQQELADTQRRLQQLADQRAQVPLPPTISSAPSTLRGEPTPQERPPTYLLGPPQRSQPTAPEVTSPPVLTTPQREHLRDLLRQPPGSISPLRLETPPLPPSIGGRGGPPSPPHGGNQRRGRSPSPPRRPPPNFAGELAQALAPYLTAPRAPNEVPRQAPIKISKPATYDGKPKSAFRSWWKSVALYFRFYPETRDEQRIAFVGSLLTDNAKEWHQARDDLLLERRGRDNWTAYSEAIINEYTDPREGAAAHDQLKALKYKGDIKAYLTTFTTLNRLAGSTGEGLQDIVNRALPREIINVRFYQNPRALTNDQDFLTATYEAGRHVETLTALGHQLDGKTSGAPAPKKDDKDGQGSGKSTGKAATSQGDKGGSKPTGTSGSGGKSERTGKFQSQYTGDNRWGSKAEALRGVPKAESTEYEKSPDNCWRCGDTGHKTYECYRHHTVRGTELPKAPWRSSAVQPTKKRARNDDDDEKPPATKAQKIAAIDTMEVEQPAVPHPWEDSESDF
jgi:hypothetical protein